MENVWSGLNQKGNMYNEIVDVHVNVSVNVDANVYANVHAPSHSHMDLKAWMQISMYL